MLYTSFHGGQAMSIAVNIKTRREQIGKTQQQLANETGLSRSMINKAENNLKFNPTIKTLKKISNKLDCDISDLLKRRAG